MQNHNSQRYIHTTHTNKPLPRSDKMSPPTIQAYIYAACINGCHHAVFTLINHAIDCTIHSPQYRPKPLVHAIIFIIHYTSACIWVEQTQHLTFRSHRMRCHMRCVAGMSPNGTSIGSSVFTQLTVVSNTQTHACPHRDRHTDCTLRATSVATARIYSAACNAVDAG